MKSPAQHREEIKNQIMKSYIADPLEKGGGEGSRGGRVIGHTKSGKPIYFSDDATFDHASAHKNFKPEDHREAIQLHRKFGKHLKQTANSYFVGTTSNKPNPDAEKLYSEGTSHDLWAKEHERMNEKKGEYENYHDTFSSAVQNARGVAEAKGYQIDEDDWTRQVAFGQGRPKNGGTTRMTVGLIKDGKPQKKALQMSVYDMGEKYELTAYIN